jgi:hypothetical protein
VRYNGFYPCYDVRGNQAYHAEDILVTLLKINNKVWMLDDPPHWWNMQDQAGFFHGHVVCAGLGLGLIVHALHDNPRVHKITVIEREKDVIDLVGPRLPREKLEIVHRDFWDWRDAQPDSVFFDLFVGNGLELIGHAIRVFILLTERFGDIPIHIFGFPNRLFDEIRTSLSYAMRSHHEDRDLETV